MDTSAEHGYTDLDALLSQFRRYAVKTPIGQEALGYSYLRFSSGPQEEGDSVRRQRSLRDAWLKRNPHVRLDTSLSLEDLKVSGFTGEHRRNPKHALAQFLALVEGGRVPVGSYLIVENLDRLTRENPVQSIPAVLSLIAAGVRVVQLAPAEVVYDAEMDQGKLMMMLWELARGHGESSRKSNLLGEVWSQKKRAAREGVPHGRRVPSWIELVDGEYRIRPVAGRVVRDLFRWSSEGLGINAIIRRLNDRGVSPISGGLTWNTGYVAKILSSRAALGEYQPGKGRHGQIPDGDPIPGYFPAVVSEADWYAAQSAKRDRCDRTGRPARDGAHTSPFAGLLYSALDGERLRVRHSHGNRVLASAARVEGRPDYARGHFCLAHLVNGLLSQLAEVSAADVFSDPGAALVAELEGRLDDVQKRLSVADVHFDADPESEYWSKKATACDRERRDLVAALAEARRRSASPASATWEEAVRLMRRDDPARLRRCLLATVAGVWCVFVKRGEIKLAAVQVRFVGSDDRRDYVVLSQIPTGNKASERKGRWGALSLDKLVRKQFDLQDRAQAQAITLALESADLSRFDRA